MTAAGICPVGAALAATARGAPAGAPDRGQARSHDAIGCAAQAASLG